jgi:hypothetical protein
LKSRHRWLSYLRFSFWSSEARDLMHLFLDLDDGNHIDTMIAGSNPWFPAKMFPSVDTLRDPPIELGQLEISDLNGGGLYVYIYICFMIGQSWTITYNLQKISKNGDLLICITNPWWPVVAGHGISESPRTKPAPASFALVHMPPLESRRDRWDVLF